MTDTRANPFIGGLRKGATAASHFTIVANLIARDRRLSLMDKGLMLCLLSHVEGFRITEGSLASQCTDGVKAIRASLNRLRSLGYVYRSTAPLRHPKGTRNADGKLIGGGIAGYEWFVTDKPDEIAIILDQYAKEQLADTTSLLDPKLGDPVDNSIDDTLEVPDLDRLAPVDNPDLTALWAASADQREQVIIPGGDLRPKPTGGLGRAIEDQLQKTKEQEDQPHAPASGCEASSPKEGSHATDPSPAADVGGPAPVPPQHGDQQTARARELDDPTRRAEIAATGGAAPVRARRAPSWREVRRRRPVDESKRELVRDELDSRRRRGLASVPGIAPPPDVDPADVDG